MIAAADRLVVDGAEPADRARPAVLQVRSSAAPSRSAARRSRGDRRRSRSSRHHSSALQVGRASARKSSGGSGTSGMLTPGLMRLRIGDPAGEVAARVRQRARGERRAARDMRQVGADVPPAVVPRIVWHMTQGRDRKTSRPRCAVGGCRRGGAADAAASRQRSKASARLGDDVAAPCARAAGRRTRRTGRGRCPAGRPEARSSLCWPGIRSCLPCRFGTQKLWITSGERSVEPHRPADRDVELVGGGDDACSASGPGTRTSHHHWWPVTSIVHRGLSATVQRARGRPNSSRPARPSSDRRR